MKYEDGTQLLPEAVQKVLIPVILSPLKPNLFSNGFRTFCDSLCRRRVPLFNRLRGLMSHFILFSQFIQTRGIMRYSSYSK